MNHDDDNHVITTTSNKSPVPCLVTGGDGMDCLHSLEPCSYGTMNATMIHLDYLKSCSNSQSSCRGMGGIQPLGLVS